MKTVMIKKLNLPKTKKLSLSISTKNNHIVQTNGCGMLSHQGCLNIVIENDFLLLPKNNTINLFLYSESNVNLYVYLYKLSGGKHNEDSKEIIDFLKAKNNILSSSIQNKEYIINALENNLNLIINNNQTKDIIECEIKSKVKELISTDIKLKWTTKEICKRLYISQATLYRALKSENTSIKQILYNIRLDRAKQLINNSKLSIGEISFESGFNSSSYFCKQFKTKFKISPIEYKQSLTISR